MKKRQVPQKPTSNNISSTLLNKYKYDDQNLTFAENSLAPKKGHFLATVRYILTQSFVALPFNAVHFSAILCSNILQGNNYLNIV